MKARFATRIRRGVNGRFLPQSVQRDRIERAIIAQLCATELDRNGESCT